MSTKPKHSTEQVIKDDGSIITITRVAAKDLALYMELQQTLLEEYIKVDGALGMLMSDTDFISKLQSLCALLPIVEKTKSADVRYLDFEDIKDNWEQLVVLFFNGGYDPETRKVEEVLPSKISQLHFFPYGKVLTETLRQVRKERELEEKED